MPKLIREGTRTCGWNERPSREFVQLWLALPILLSIGARPDLLLRVLHQLRYCAMESRHGIELRSDLGIWLAAYSIAVRRPLISGCHQSRSSLCWKKQEGSRCRLYSRRKPTGLDHADLDKFVVNRLRFSASAPSWKPMVADC